MWGFDRAPTGPARPPPALPAQRRGGRLLLRWRAGEAALCLARGAASASGPAPGRGAGRARRAAPSCTQRRPRAHARALRYPPPAAPQVVRRLWEKMEGQIRQVLAADPALRPEKVRHLRPVGEMEGPAASQGTFCSTFCVAHPLPRHWIPRHATQRNRHTHAQHSTDTQHSQRAHMHTHMHTRTHT
jgi:hypothetical protein